MSRGSSTGAASKYHVVKRALLERIAARQYTETLAVPPEGVLAEEFGVAPVTARRAIHELVAEGFLVRHVGRGHGTFVRSGRRPVAASPPGRRLARIGVVTGLDWEALRASPIFFLTFLDVQAECVRQGVALELLPVQPNEGVRTLRRRADDSRCDALVAMGWPTPDVLLEVHAGGLPVVVAGPWAPETPLPCVMPNDYQGAYAVTRHLLGLGHTRVGIVSPEFQNTVSAARQLGWRDAQRPAAEDPRLIYRHSVVPGKRLTFEETRQELAEQFRRQAPPSAVFGRDSVLAYAAILALRDIGLRCPEDVSVACVGSFHEQALEMPRMTTAVPEDGALGQMVLRIAEDLLSGRQSAPITILLPMGVVEGVTSAPAPA